MLAKNETVVEAKQARFKSVHESKHLFQFLYSMANIQVVLRFPIWKVMHSNDHFANWFRNTPIIIMMIFVECPRSRFHANKLTLENKF